MSSQRKLVYVGAGAWEGETGRIQVFDFEPATTGLTLVQELAAGGVAAFMVRSRDGKVLYVADETQGLLRSYGVDSEGRLELSAEAECAGHPVYLALHRTGRFLLTCFFAEGKTEVFRLRDDGHVGESVCVVPSGRESHSTVLTPAHDGLLVPTRGDGWIAQFEFSSATGQLRASTPARHQEEPGAGPRHLTFHPNGRYAYLVNELSLTLSVYAWDSVAKAPQRIAAGISTRLPGTTGGSAADVHVHPNGRYLYVSNRQGDDSNLAVVSLADDGALATVLRHESTRGRTPRNFTLDSQGQWLFVANRESDKLVVFRTEQAGAGLKYAASHDVASGPFYVGVYEPS